MIQVKQAAVECLLVCAMYCRPRPVLMQAVLKRQRERESFGDNVPYVLARTVRSNIQYEAAIIVGAKGVGNQADRGECMERAMSMFSGKGDEGIPRDVVLALMRA